VVNKSIYNPKLRPKSHIHVTLSITIVLRITAPLTVFVTLSENFVLLIVAKFWRVHPFLIEGRRVKFRQAPTLTTRNIFGPNSDEMVGGWRNLHKEELHNVYSSPEANRMIESRKMR
jgi:hypothetical protein